MDNQNSITVDLAILFFLLSREATTMRLFVQIYTTWAAMLHSLISQLPDDWEALTLVLPG
jgi:hypothetical protein